MKAELKIEFSDQKEMAEFFLKVGMNMPQKDTEETVVFSPVDSEDISDRAEEEKRQKKETKFVPRTKRPKSRLKQKHQRIIRRLYKDFFKQHPSRDKVSRTVLDTIEALTGLNRKVIQTYAYKYGLTTGKKKGCTRTKKDTSAGTMIRREPYVPKDKIKGKITAEKNGEGLLFPLIFPTAETSRFVLKDIFTNAKEAEQQITMLSIAPHIHLKNGFEWDERTWRIFCEQVQMHSDKICKAMEWEFNSIKICNVGGMLSISIKR